MKYWKYIPPTNKKLNLRQYDLYITIPINYRTNNERIEDSLRFATITESWKDEVDVKDTFVDAQYHQFRIVFHIQHMTNYTFFCSDRVINQNENTFITYGKLNDYTIQDVMNWTEERVLKYYHAIYETLREPAIIKSPPETPVKSPVIQSTLKVKSTWQNIKSSIFNFLKFPPNEII